MKKDLYQERFRTPEYFWFSPDSLEFEGFKLVGQYQVIAPNERGWRWSEELGLYLGVEEGKLRYFTPSGDKLPTPEEAALQERQEKEIAQRRAERLAEQLRLLAIDPAGD